jgi:3-mercaptopyruvate sulfurtransferase SseA
MKKTIAILLLFLLLTGCTVYDYYKSRFGTRTQETVANEAKKGGYQLITPEELKKEYLTDPAAFLLVDTRQEWSYQMQHIQGASHIDFAPTWWNQYSPMTRSEMKKLLGPDKNKKVVFY